MQPQTMGTRDICWNYCLLRFDRYTEQGKAQRDMCNEQKYTQESQIEKYSKNLNIRTKILRTVIPKHHESL